MSKHKRKHKKQNQYTLVTYCGDEPGDIFIIMPGYIQLVGWAGTEYSHLIENLGKTWEEDHILGDSDLREPTQEEIDSIKEWLPRSKWNFAL